jgi:hypothetical protein
MRSPVTSAFLGVVATAAIAWCSWMPAVSGATAAAPAAADAFLQQHCLRCHDGETQEGQFRLDTLSRDFASVSAAQKWAEVMTRINAGEMPPEEEPRPSADEIAAAVGWIAAGIEAGEAARMAARGPVAFYRLSREEWGHTIRDLLGVQLDIHEPGLFNDDPRWHGFDRIGSLLALSPSHIDKYLRAAEIALARAFPETEVPPAKMRFDAVHLATSNLGHEPRQQARAKLEQAGVADKVRVAVWPGGSKPARRGWWDSRLNRPGVYRCRIQLSGLQPPGGRAPHLSIAGFDADVVAAEDEPVVVEFERFLSPGDVDFKNAVAGRFPEGHTNNVLDAPDNFFISSRDRRFLNPSGYKLTDDEGRAIRPLLLVDWIEWEGPLTTDEDRRRRAGLWPADPENPDDVQACLVRFAERAWRRPVAVDELAAFAAIVADERAAGEPFRAAYLSALAAILVSNEFLYLQQGSPTEQRSRLDDIELASRLSYFLWSSLPDEPLLAAARGGVLHKPDVLRSQATRMMADPRIARFTSAFPRQWLQLHRVGMFQPDRTLYPDYEQWLEKSFKEETVRYFAEMFRENLPIREFLDSDWTILNPRLAEHYGLPSPPTGEFARVSLPPESHRGGILTHGSLLSLTSDGTRHRPVHRGVLVSEAIFGVTPPPPPPNVEPLPPTPADVAKATVRMQLAAHSTHAACAACHRKIDPLGLAFDNFDAIGRWRSVERVTAGQGDDPPVDASGTLADGRSFDGPDAFKKLLAADEDRFAEAFVGTLATFALRRAMTIDDADELRWIVAASRPAGYRLQTLVENLILSDLFQAR